MDDFDENGNHHLRFRVRPLPPPVQERIDYLHANDPLPPLSRAFYAATSPSIDYVHDAINTIRNLLNERKTELNDDDYEMVLVWDIADITTVALEHFVEITLFHRETDADYLRTIIDRILDRTKFCKFFDQKNVVNIEDVLQNESEDMKERAPMYIALEKFYNEISNDMRDDGPIINYELIQRCGLTLRVLPLYSAAVQMQRLFHQRWKTARKCLELVNESHETYTNVVLCQDGIGNGAAQMLLSGTSKQIDFENLYSYKKEPKEKVFERIQKRFGENCVLVHITSRTEIACIPEKLQIPIWEVKANDSIEHLYNALKNDLFFEE